MQPASRPDLPKFSKRSGQIRPNIQSFLSNQKLLSNHLAESRTILKRKKIFFIPRKKKLSSLLVMASFLPRNWLQAKTVTPSGIFLQ